MAFGPFSKCTEACGPVIHFLVFMSVFGIWLIFEIQRSMLPGYIFSRFHEHFLHLLVSNCFWHFAHFRNAQKHAIRSYIFLVFTSVFGILPIFEMHKSMRSGHTFFSFSQVFLAFCPFLKCSEACGLVIFFLVFMRDLKKVIKVNVRSVD